MARTVVPTPGNVHQESRVTTLNGFAWLAILSGKKVVALDDERKASMVSNVMTVLYAESDVRPVVNTGTLYN